MGDYIPSLEYFKKQREASGELKPLQIPKEYKKLSIFNPVYRNIEFCINECKSIVDQLAKKAL